MNAQQKIQLKRKNTPVPHWFNKNKFRNELLKHVNNFSNGRWEAVSTPNGILFFRYSTLIYALSVSSNYHPDVLALAVDKVAMNDLVYTVLKQCGDDSVIWNFMGKGYIACKCRCFNRDGIETEITYLTPFKASWFGVLPSRFEKEKSLKIRNCVHKIQLIRGQYHE